VELWASVTEAPFALALDSAGLPVFATKHGGIPEAIENGVSGILVPERDHEALLGTAEEVKDRRETHWLRPA